MPATRVRRVGVRFNKHTNAFEMFCPDCARKRGPTFWPLTFEFWPHNHLQRCLACDAEKKRQATRERRKRIDPVALAAYNRAYYQQNRKSIRWKDDQRKAARRAQRGVASTA